MFNFATPEAQAEFERIRELGATIIAAPYELGGVWIATLAHPDGNYVQLVTPMG